ncbi:MAG: HzsA-related protein [Planctomycetota bacterium]|jgi:cytochrome c553
MGLYLFSADGEMELLHRDPEITSAWPLPVKPRDIPHELPNTVERFAPATDEGAFLLADVHRGLKTVGRGDIKSLRIVAVPVKTHPSMNRPQIGLTADDPGKCVLGTVPVEEDGSAHFRVPAGVSVFFQALDARGAAVQTMRSATYVQPGQTLSCVGCHEPRSEAPPVKLVRAARRAPSGIAAGPEGSWPLRFDRLVQPVLDRKCVRCHSPEGEMKAARRLDFGPAKAYWSLVKAGKPSLHQHVRARYHGGRSIEGECAAAASPILAQFDAPKGHNGVKLDADARERLITWMDTYAQRLGSFSDEQEELLVRLREDCAEFLVGGAAPPVPAE